MRTAIVTLLLAIVALCLFGQALSGHCGIFREFQAALLSMQWMLLVCLSIWCGTFLFLTFSRKDWLLICLLLMAIVHYFTGPAEFSRAADAVILLAAATLGRGARFALNEEGRMKNEEIEVGKQKAESGNIPEIVNCKSAIVNFLVGLIGLLAFASWWHLEVAHNFYPGTRWTGLWNNPNIYGMLMGAGVVLAIGLLTTNQKLESRKQKSDSRNLSENRKSEKAESGKLILRLLRSFAAIKSAILNPLSSILVLAIGMMAVGLVMSYSRGAWVATAIGLLYLTWSYGKLKWKYVILGAGLLALGVGLVWGNTSDSGPWYLKRLDFSRPSAQHRVSAWRGAVQMMWDHPLGVGWNQAVSVYDKNYSPPEGGAVALTMNSYLMLGTELGLPGLLCFVAYVALQLGVGRWQMADRIGKAEGGKRKAETLQQIGNRKSEIGNQVACRAGAIVLLVAFWFDGGLFDLPTAAVFWVLLELGVEKAEIHLTKVKSEKPKPAEYLAAKEHKEHIDTDSSPHPSPRLARRGRNFLRSLRSFVAIKSGIGNRQLVRASLPRRLPRQVVLH
jgi:hypothetical protein